MQSLARTKVLTQSKLINLNNYSDHDEALSFSELYTKILITKLLQTRRSEYVAKGIIELFNGYNKNDNENVDSDKNDHETLTLSLLLISSELIARDASTLILSLLQCANALEYIVEKDSTISSLPYIKKRHRYHNTNCRVRTICNALFHSCSTEHQEKIVEQLTFSNKSSYSGFCNNGGVTEASQKSSREKNKRRWSRWVTEIFAPPATSLNRNENDGIISFSKRLANIADRWSQLTFVHEVEDRQQHHVSLVLWHGLVIIERFALSLNNPGQRKLTAALVSGVSHRLGSILPTLRQDGMRIAQQLAKGLGQHDIRFDEFVVDDDTDSDSDIWDDNRDDSCNNEKIDKDETETIKTREKKQSKLEHHRFFDPDADYDSDVEEKFDFTSETKDERLHTSTNVAVDNGDDVDSEDDDELSVEWKDELIPYNLEDDEEDLRETPRPLHLLQALDFLRTGENHDHALTRHESCLEALPSLIRKRPDDLADVAVSMALELLRMEDKFNIDDFNKKREFAIRTLLVEEPLSVGQTLIEQLFEESGLLDKLSILSSLQSAAFELSGNKDLAEAINKSVSSKKASLFVGQHGGDTSLLPLQNQISRARSKTLQKRSRSQQKAITNHFSNIAPLWFYSLISEFVKHKEDQSLWTGPIGSTLLAYFFRCLATIVEFSGVQASQVLANDLLDLVWDFRTADVREVRLSVLVALSSSIAMLSNEKLIKLLFEEAILPKTMHEMSRTDQRAFVCAFA